MSIYPRVPRTAAHSNETGFQNVTVVQNEMKTYTNFDRGKENMSSLYELFVKSLWRQFWSFGVETIQVAWRGHHKLQPFLYLGVATPSERPQERDGQLEAPCVSLSTQASVNDHRLALSCTSS